MTDMPQRFESEISMLHIAGGAPRLTPPPGTAVEAAPRRAARGRKDDIVFVNLSLRTEEAHPGLLDQLADSAAQAYFGTPRSVTAGLRAAAEEVYLRLLDLNTASSGSAPLHVDFLIGVQRGMDVFTAQCGVGQTILVRPSNVSRYSSAETAGRPLGGQSQPFIRYFHFEVQPGDLVILSTHEPPVWPDPALSALSDLTLEQAVDRLTAGREGPLTGLAIRIGTARERGASPIKPFMAEPQPIYSTEGPASEEVDADGFIRERGSNPPLQLLGDVLHGLGHGVASALSGSRQVIAKLITRMAPGVSEPERTASIPPTVLATTAVLVPIFVVLVAGVAYLRIGKGEQFEEYLSGAEAAVADARAEADPEAARYHWMLALEWLNLAQDYGDSEESRSLRAQVQRSLDSLDLIIRLDFQPAVQGGFGADADLTSLVASESDLYALDAANRAVWHAWATGRGFELDADFKCIQDTERLPGSGAPVGIAAFGDPALQRGEGIISVDASGMIAYCWPGETPIAGQLVEPDLGWGRLQALEAYGDYLYLLDPDSNAIWLYEASNGQFTGQPSLYFADFVPDLSGAIDIARTQDRLLILYGDGHLDRCERSLEAAGGGGVEVRVECDPDPQFQDERPGYEGSTHIPGAIPTEIVYSAPPEPAIYILDSLTGNVFHYSMRLVYQGQYRPEADLDSPPSSIAFGSPNTLFMGAGDQVYYAQTER
jgi:hypothetical protein